MINTRIITCGIIAAAMAGAGAAAPAALARTPARASRPAGAARGGGCAATTALPGARQLADSAVPFAGQRARTLVAGPRRLTLQVWLAPRTAAAESYASDASTPGGASFGHYLSPSAFAARFGATPGQAAAVEAWLRSAGFTGVTTDSQLSYVRATAPVSVIDHALHVQVRYYAQPSQQAAGSYPLRANDRPVSVPASLAGSVLGITGLDNAPPAMTWSTPARLAPGPARRPSGPARPAGGPAVPAPGAPPLQGAGPSFPCSAWYAQHYARSLPPIYGATQFPTQVCGYSAVQLRRAYEYDPAFTGKGQTIALVELGLVPYMFRTLQDFAQSNNITSPDATGYRELSIGQGDDCGTPFDVEEQMDVETTYAMAPGATRLVVGGDSCDNGDYGLQALFNAVNVILDGNGRAPLASIISNSWEGFSENQPSEIDSIEHSLLVRAAAEGVGMYFSAGDSSGVLTPASDPYAISVGGTTLGVGNTDPRLFETGWSTGMYTDPTGSWQFQGEEGGTGGGQSQLWAQPAYQQGVVPAALARAPGNRAGLVRTVPDISADADPFTGMAVGTMTLSSAGQPVSYATSPTGGTSLSTPLIAALVADAQQGMPRPFGFLNPVLYRLAGTPAFYAPEPVTDSAPSRYKAIACGVSDCGVLSLANFDDQSWSMSGYTGQVATAGYSTMTGIGTPDGSYFIPLLRKLES
jgi:subtilase family serine protease